MEVPFQIGVSVIKPGDIVVSHPRWGQGERVCFITEHTRLSTVALQLNSPIEVTFKELASSKGYDCAEDQPVYRGGDYNSSALIMLHDHAWYSANTMVVNTEWSISSDLHMLEKIIHGNTPNFYRYVLGITAWPHQGLERDLASERPTWIALNSPSLDIVMSDASQQYELALEAVGSGFWNSYF